MSEKRNWTCQLKLRDFNCMLLFLMIFSNQGALAYEEDAHAHPERVSPFKPVFFVVGKPHTKLQFSFKAEVVENVPLYLAYTQTSFWALFKRSLPFVDTSYSPELFYRWTDTNDANRSFDFGGQHESNGRDGIDSRSWNRIFARYSFKQDTGTTRLYWTLQAWVPFTSHDLSRYLVHYRGLYELTLTWADFLGENFDQDDLTLRLFPGGSSEMNPLEGGQELTLRLKSKTIKFLPLLVFQMFYGYAENLLEFRDKVWVARVGLGL